MRRTIVIATAVIAVCIGTGANAETLKVADARADKSTESNAFVMFVSKRNGEAMPIGSAFMVVGRGEAPDAIETEAAFGMYFEGRAMKIGKIPQETIDAVRSSEEGQPTITFIARVNEDVYQTALSNAQAWERGEQITPGPPPLQILECTRIMILRIGELKEPYIAAFNPDSQIYYEDISTLNRKK